MMFFLLAFLLLGPAFAPSGQTPAPNPLAEIHNLRYYTHPNFTRIVLDASVLREYVWNETLTPSEITVDVMQARLNPIVPEVSAPSRTDYIKRLRIAQKSPTTVRLTIEADLSRIRLYQVYNVADPFRIVIDIYPKEKTAPAAAEASAPAPKPKTPQPAEPVRGGYSLARQLGLGVRTVILDPGHGGMDPGCLDPAGPQEKALTLDIALRLKAILEAETDLSVILTRETDIHVPLETRTVVANQRKADLFISIHVNADRRRAEASKRFS
jgi:N-acetylmuramoyl-L-alanine amidase